MPTCPRSGRWPKPRIEGAAMTQTDLSVILPEILLAVFAMATLLGVVYAGKDKLATGLTWTTVAALPGLGLWLAFSRSGSTTAFHGMFIDDAFARFGKVTILFSGAAVLAMSEAYMTRRGLLR